MLVFFIMPNQAQSLPQQSAFTVCSGALTGKDPPDQVILACTEVIATRGIPTKQLADAYNNRGIAHANKRQFDLAIADYTQALTVDPSNEAAFNNRAARFLVKRDYRQAIADYSETIKLDKDAIGAYWGRGIAYSQEGNFQNAIADYIAVIRIDPTGGIYGYGAYMGLGHAYVATKEFQKAIETYTRAMEKVVTPTAFFLERGLVYRQLHDIADSASDYNEALRRDPKLTIGGPYDPQITDQSPIELKYALAYKVLGNGFLADGDNTSAIAMYDEAIKLYPQYAAAINNRGVGLLNMMEYTNALIQFYSAIKLNPQFPLAYNNRANAFFKIGMLDEALADYNTALSLNPKLATALYPRALIERAKGKKDAAARDETAATAIDPQIANQFADYKIDRLTSP
jgi:tetratricopeptide (TPR) repeat protein